MDGSPKVKSDQTLLSILSVLRDRGPARLSDIAGEVGVAKSTVHDHLAMLEDRNFATKTDEGYDLGLRFLDYGLESRRRRSIFEQGRRKVEEVADVTGERSWCIVEEGGEAVFICGATGERSFLTSDVTGTRRPLHCLAAGKAIMAHLPEDHVEAIVEEQGLAAVTEHTITDRKALEEELERVRERGVAYNLEEGDIGVHAVGAPVLDVDGFVFGAISVAGPANRFAEDRLETELAELIKGAATELGVNIRA